MQEKQTVLQTRRPIAEELAPTRKKNVALYKMTEFQSIVMTIAIIILIIVLLIVGILIWRDRYKDILPAVLPGCPSPGWTITGEGKDRICKPQGSPPGMKGICSNGFPYVASNSKADACRALSCAQECNIAWDGITGNPQYTTMCKKSTQACGILR